MTNDAHASTRCGATILDVGQDAGTGGYRRFAWSDADLTLREWFRGCAETRGMAVEEDRNGNLWAWWLPPGWTGDPTDAFVTGSHLDSVPDGGAFDGPLGVVSAFAAIDIVRDRGVVPTIPVAVAAFSDEEGARFGVACVGSQLVTGALSAERARGLRDNDGVTLAEALTRAGRNPEHLGVDDALLERIGVYVELHVEQGRALDLVDRPIAVASAIWPHGRWEFTFDGAANHAGTTRLVDRRDPMLAFASSVHAARSAAARHEAVATFGKVLVSPNGANAIPSRVRAWLDARAADEATLTALVEQISAEAGGFAAADGIDLARDRRIHHAHRRIPAKVRAPGCSARWRASATCRCCRPRPATTRASCRRRCRRQCCSCATRPGSRTRRRSTPRPPTATRAPRRWPT